MSASPYRTQLSADVIAGRKVVIVTETPDEGLRRLNHVVSGGIGPLNARFVDIKEPWPGSRGVRDASDDAELLATWAEHDNTSNVIRMRQMG